MEHPLKFNNGGVNDGKNAERMSLNRGRVSFGKFALHHSQQFILNK